MNLLLTPEALRSRDNVARGPLEPLAKSLADDLEPLLTRELFFPSEKAVLSREGGRCARDGTLLEFDPFEPNEHRCPKCGEVYRGELHYRFWIYWYQLWLAERAVHAAALAALGADVFAPLASRILEGYVERYETYPNVDNVLGPTRLFFSTYLESIWLLQICFAIDFLGDAAEELGGRVRDRIIAPSRAIIAEHDEGASNRQVWNAAALLASARLLGDVTGADAAVYGSSGLLSHLANGLLPDGTWYEGENYHLFAHRGLWYGVTMAERAALELPNVLIDRFERGFTTPFATALPDFTLPSRRDSQYAVSLRQWRFAEHCELGLARRDDPLLASALRRMYSADIPHRDTGRSRSSADVERNAPASALTRADLSWRALLFARPELPVADAPPPQSVLLDSQGIAVFRRDDARVYAALDYGHSGGGHGHPDRLNLLLAVGDVRWLDDFGTGSYTDPSLHWYRSTLAHNAPFLNGQSQARVHGELIAYDERDSVGWIVAVANGIAPDAHAVRTLVMTPTYAVDAVVWRADRPIIFDLPLHADLRVERAPDALKPSPIAGGDGLEDGFRFLRDTRAQSVPADETVVARAVKSDASLDVFATSDRATEWFEAVAPGAPGSGDHTFRVVRALAQDGQICFVWSWAGDVTGVAFGDTIRVTLADGTVHIHEPTDDGWRVDLGTGEVELDGLIEPSLEAPAVTYEAPMPPGMTLPLSDQPLVIELGEAHYRRSEQSWRDAGEPAATIALAWSGRSFDVTVDVPRSDLTFIQAGAENPFDNEYADINGDGVQLFLRTNRGYTGWLLVPDADSDAVRARQIEGWTSPWEVDARWERQANGYRMAISVPGELPPEAFDVVVNEMPRGRVRRRGQLVVSGGAGEFTYLRGDRHDPRRLIALRLADD